MVKCGVLFEVRPEFLNIISMSFGFKGNDNFLPIVFTNRKILLQ
jgi:hypothetical protein